MSDANALTVPGDGYLRDNLSISGVHQQPGTRTGYIGVADAVRIIRRRLWIIVLTVLAAAIGALVFLARTTPVYTATTAVMVESADQATDGSPAPTIIQNENDDALIQTKVELLQSRSLARQLVRTLQLDRDQEFAPNESEPSLTDTIFAYITPAAPSNLDARELADATSGARREAITDRLIDHIDVSRVARSNVITITAYSVDPSKAALIANRLVDTYMHNQIDEANASREQQIAALSDRVSHVRAQLEQADSATAVYRRSHGLLSSQPESSGALEVGQLTGLHVQARADSVADSRKAGAPNLADGRAVATSSLLNDLRQQETILSRKMSELTSFYGTGYPQVGQTAAELSAVRARLSQETARVRADLRAQASASQARSASIGAAITALRSNSFSGGQAAVSLRALERNVEALNTSYMNLLNQLNAKIGSPPDTNPDITRISRAPVANSPDYPLPHRVLAVTLIASAAFGILLAFIVDTMDTKLRTAEQVRRLLGIPTLAMIPELEEGHGLVHNMVAGRPRSRFAEAMRNLVIELESRIERSGGRVIVVTSPLEGEGKNTVATSLVAAAGVIGRNAVVVDFDLRRPGLEIGQSVQEERGAGVVAFLANRAAVDDLVTVEGEGRFTVIGVGETAQDPGALIASPQLPKLLAELRERFELVIINAPPILPVRDAKTLADYADATLLVLRWGRTSPEAAAAAMEIFGRPITGAVLNRVDFIAHANRRYGDAIHHISRSTAYYESEAHRGHWRGRVKRWSRRAGVRVSEALHLT